MRVGVIGGGQLGRMLALAGAPLGIECIGLEPAADPPMAAVTEVVAASFDDLEAVGALARRCDVMTVELEHVDADVLRIVDESTPVRPGPRSVAVAQDRLVEKRFLRGIGLRTAPFSTAGEASPGLPAIVKTRRGGFDGRGQRRVNDADGLAIALAELPDPIVEGVVGFSRELSVVAARGTDGSVLAYPLVENLHADGILRVTIAPAPAVSDPTAIEAAAIARAILEGLDYVGVIGIELFETPDGLIVNEIAPRVHNSGHWTMDGAATSQFEQHLRAVCGLPLGAADPIGRSAMINLIGVEPESRAVLAIGGAHLHRYGKSPRPGRKLGHVNLVARDLDHLREQLSRLAEVVPDAVLAIDRLADRPRGS